MSPVIAFDTRKVSRTPDLESRERFVPLSMAFQPIVDVDADGIFAYEALVRGINREPAATMLGQTGGGSRYDLDQCCRIAAIEWAARLGLMHTRSDLFINFSPNTLVETEFSLSNTCAVAESVGLPLSRIVFEITEMEKIHDHDLLRGVMESYRSQGLRTAIDDFGAGYAGLSMLAAFQPDIIKIDMELTRGIHERRASRAIVRSIVQVCKDLDIDVIAEGIEMEAEFEVLHKLGIRKFQGYYFGRPGFESLPTWKSTSRQYRLI
jgi:EAL domain-containing protein (putative c-di-GMP-specific phosphodiesterase class I)